MKLKLHLNTPLLNASCPVCTQCTNTRIPLFHISTIFTKELFMKGPVILTCIPHKWPRAFPSAPIQLLHIEADNQRNDAQMWASLDRWEAVEEFPQLFSSNHSQQSSSILITGHREQWGTACTVIMPVCHCGHPKMETKGRFMTLSSWAFPPSLLVT